MKKNITLCLSLMILVLVCCGITIKVMQNADKNTSSQEVMTFNADNGVAAIPTEKMEENRLTDFGVTDYSWSRTLTQEGFVNTESTITYCYTYTSGMAVFEVLRITREVVGDELIEVLYDSEGNVLRKKRFSRSTEFEAVMEVMTDSEGNSLKVQYLPAYPYEGKDNTLKPSGWENYQLTDFRVVSCNCFAINEEGLVEIEANITYRSIYTSGMAVSDDLRITCKVVENELIKVFSDSEGNILKVKHSEA